jgi:hypothetical protein
MAVRLPDRQAGNSSLLPATASLKGEKMVKTITVEWLQSKGACKESLEAWH